MYISGITGSTTIENGKKYKSVPNTISFSINNDAQTADPDMTWTQWVNSSYNTDKFSIRDNYVVNDDAVCHVNDVVSSDTIISGKNYTISSGSIIAVDLSKVGVGSTFNFGKYQVESEIPWAIEWEIVHQTDDYQIAQTKQIIDLRCFDAKESANTDSNRKNYGNNNWQYSNIKQFLNSDQATWYSSQHQYDAPPNSTNVANGNPYNTHKGFLYYFSDEEKNLLKDMTLTLANNTVTDGGGSYTWTGKVWLPTYTQMTGNTNNSISEGIKFDKYNSNSDRIKSINKYCAENNKYCIDNNYSEGTNWYYWMSSARPSGSHHAWHVDSDGDYTTDRAYDGHNGLAPCIYLSKSTILWGTSSKISFTIENSGSYSGGDFTVRYGASWSEFLKSYTEISEASGHIMGEGDMYLCDSSGTQVSVYDQIIANETYSWI